MGLIASLIMEKKVGHRWENIGDILSGNSAGQLDYHTIPHNRLIVAHLLGADTLWAALVVLTARLTIEPVEEGNRE